MAGLMQEVSEYLQRHNLRAGKSYGQRKAIVFSVKTTPSIADLLQAVAAGSGGRPRRQA
jgi:hypothetical protein